MSRGTSPLPPHNHYMHLNTGQPPPPPPPEAPRITKSTSDQGTQNDPIAQAGGQPPPPQPPPSGLYGRVRMNRTSPYDPIPETTPGKPPPPPPPSGAQSYFIGDTPMGNQENRALSIEMRRQAEEQRLWEEGQDKKARNKTAFKQYLMEIDKQQRPVKRAADEASNSVAQQALELAHAAARARRGNELQARQDKISMLEELKRQAAMQRAELETATRELSSHHKAREASHQKRVAVERASLEHRRQQVEAERKAIEIKKMKKPAPRAKRQAAPPRAVSTETIYEPPANNSRSRSRAKSAGPILPTPTQMQESATLKAGKR